MLAVLISFSCFLVYCLFRQIIDKYSYVTFSFQGEGYWKEGIFIFHVMIPEEYNIKVAYALVTLLHSSIKTTSVHLLRFALA